VPLQAWRTVSNVEPQRLTETSLLLVAVYRYQRSFAPGKPLNPHGKRSPPVLAFEVSNTVRVLDRMFSAVVHSSFVANGTTLAVTVPEPDAELKPPTRRK
jgi:hypothetical protein